MTTDLKHCAVCQFHRLLGGDIHLCTLPPYCAPPMPDDGVDRDAWLHSEACLSLYVGTACDVMRRMGALCGPRGRLWSPANGR